MDSTDGRNPLTPGAIPEAMVEGFFRLCQGEFSYRLPRTLTRDADVVFLALPDKAAAELAPALVEAGVRVIDLSGAFRLRDQASRAKWYPETHDLPAALAYGLTELERPAIGAALGWGVALVVLGYAVIVFFMIRKEIRGVFDS